MEGSQGAPPYTTGATCYTAGCQREVQLIQYLNQRPAIYSCLSHETTEATATCRIDNIKCYTQNCERPAKYRLTLGTDIHDLHYPWLCDACVSLTSPDYEGHSILQINRPRPVITTSHVTPPETLASKTEILTALGATEQTPIIDTKNPMFQPIHISPDTPVTQPQPMSHRSAQLISESSGSESPLGGRSTGKNEPPTVTPPIKRSRTGTSVPMDADTVSLTTIPETNIEPDLSPLISETASSPQLHPPPTPSPPKPDLKRKQPLSFADAAKGKGKEREAEAINDDSPMSTTYCTVNEWDIQQRIPPVTDAPFSVWIDLEETPVNHTALLKYADQHPLIKGLTYRPTGNWVECYTKMVENRDKLLQEKHVVNGTTLSIREARKLAGPRLFIRLANVNPCADEEEIIDDLHKHFKPYGQIECAAPVILRDSGLTSRRWNLILVVQEGYRLVMEPVFRICGIETLAYWKGQPSVCQHCLIRGHWTSECNSAIRAQTAVRKQNKIPIIPIPSPEEIQPTPTVQAQPTQQPLTQQPPANQPTVIPATAPATQTQKPEQVTTPGQGKAGFRFQDPPKQKEAVAPGRGKSGARVKEALRRSRQINIATGHASDSTGSEQADAEDNEGYTVHQTPSQKKKQKQKEKEQEITNNKRTAVERSPMTTQGQEKKQKAGSNRPRTKGTLPDYILFCLCRGYIGDEKTAQQQINDIAPKSFIETIKPGMPPAKYKSFVSWLDRREKAGKDESTVALEGSWQVKVPDNLKPGNPGYIDTSVGIESTKKKKTMEQVQGKSTTNPSSTTEKDKQPKFSVTVSYQDEQNQTITFPSSIKQNQKISTLHKNLTRKVKNLSFKITLKGNDTPLEDEKTAIESSITDKAEIVLTQMSWTEEEYLTVRAELPNSSKIWIRKFRRTDSSRTIQWQLATDLKVFARNLLVRRGNGVALNLHTTVEDLALRDGEILRTENIDGFKMDVHWVDHNGPQQKSVWGSSQWSNIQAHRAISATLGLRFRFRLTTEKDAPSDGHDISHPHGEEKALTQLDLFLEQPGQDKWDTPITPTPASFVIRVNTSYEQDPEMIELVDTTEDLTIMDLLQAMHNNNTELTARVVMDSRQLPYHPADRLVNIACPEEPLIVFLTDALYTKETLVQAANTVALLQESQGSDLLENKYTFINQL